MKRWEENMRPKQTIWSNTWQEEEEIWILW
jgi:hypothetical protein